jgi:uncharacterized protein YbdZ (MbtH family)
MENKMDKSTKTWIDWVVGNDVTNPHPDNNHTNEVVVTEERQFSVKPTPVNRQDKFAEWDLPIHRDDNQKQTALDKMNYRHTQAQNIFTGEPLDGQDLIDWTLLERQRAYSA